MITTEFSWEAIEEICNAHVALNLNATRLLTHFRDHCKVKFMFKKEEFFAQREHSKLFQLYMQQNETIYHFIQKVIFGDENEEIEFPGKVIFDNSSKTRILKDISLHADYSKWEELFCELTYEESNLLIKRLTLRDDLTQFADLPTKLPPFNEFIFIDPFVNTFSDKALKDNLLRMAKFYSDPLTEFNLIIISSEISQKNIDDYNEKNPKKLIGNADEWFEVFFKRLETMVDELNIKCSLTLMDLMNIPRERGEESKLFHDRILITNYYQVDFGNSFNFFFGDQISHSAKRTKVTFNSHIDKDAVNAATNALNEIDNLIKDYRFRIKGAQTSRYIEFQ